MQEPVVISLASGMGMMTVFMGRQTYLLILHR